MGNVINFPISLDSDICRELIVDCARYSEGLLTEKEVNRPSSLRTVPIC